MEAFCPLKTKITPSGRPSYCTGEVEVLQQQGVGFYDGETRSSYESGTLYLTTHRLVWVDDDLKLMRGIYAPLTKINLGSVRRWFGLGPLSHPKLFVYLAEKPIKYFKMSFRKYGMDAFCSSLGATGKKQAWVAKPISDYDVLAPAPVEPVKAEKLKLHPDQCSQEGGVHVVTEANTTHGAVAVLKGLGGGPLAKAVFRFKAVGGLYDLQFSFSSSERKQSISVRANTNASARLELAPGSAEVSTIVVLEAGDNVLSIAPNLVQLEEAPPPLSVHGLVLVPAAKGRPPPQGKSPGAPQLGGISGIVTKLDKQDATEAAKMSVCLSPLGLAPPPPPPRVGLGEGVQNPPSPSAECFLLLPFQYPPPPPLPPQEFSDRLICLTHTVIIHHTNHAKPQDAMQDIDALMVMAEDISQMVTQLQSKIAQGVRGAPREEQVWQHRFYRIRGGGIACCVLQESSPLPSACCPPHTRTLPAHS